MPLHSQQSGGAGRRYRDATAPRMMRGLSPFAEAQDIGGVMSRARGDGALLNEQAYGVEPLFCDAIVILLASIASGAGYHLVALQKLGDISVFAGVGFLVAVLFCGISRYRALELPFGTASANARARAGLSSWIAAFGLFLLTAFMTRMASGLSRGAILSFFVMGAAAVLVSRVITPVLLARRPRKAALDGQDVIVISAQNDPALFRLMRDLRRTMRHDPCLVIYDNTCSDAEWPQKAEQVVRHARKLAHGAGPGEILIVGDRLQPERLDDLLLGLAELPRPICIVPDDLTRGFLRQKRTLIGESIALEIRQAPLNCTKRAIKRVMDFMLALGALALLAPVFAMIAIAIKWESRGPVFFRQTRLGYRGRTFRIFKFRTMVVLEDGPVVAQAQKDDSRFTRIGRLLRRSSLDELPQLFNVLVGDMSLVGPRPHAVAHDRSYELQIPNYTLRQHVRPGMTGWAQVNGFRGETSTLDAMNRRIEHDVWYVKNCSLALDVEIIARTPFEILRARNAY